MVAGPIGERRRSAALTQPADEIAIRIEDADGRRLGVAEPFLPSRFPEQRGRGEYRRPRWEFLAKDRDSNHVDGA
jgi:hypothetical protein